MQLRAILIDPKAKTVTEFQTEASNDDLYLIIGCTSLDVVMLSPTEALYADDEGLLQEEPGPFFQIRGHGDPIPGRGVIVGVDRAGSHVGSQMMLAEVTAMVSFPDIQFTGFEPGARKIGKSDHQFKHDGKKKH